MDQWSLDSNKKDETIMVHAGVATESNVNTNSSTKFTPFTIDNILASNSTSSKICNNLNSELRSSNINVNSNLIRPRPVRFTEFAAMHIPYFLYARAMFSYYTNSPVGGSAYPNFNSQITNVAVHSDSLAETNAIYDPHLISTLSSAKPIENQRKVSRRRRTTFTAHQLQQLKETFEKTQYPNVIERRYLAKAINLKEVHVDVWFKNQRSLYRSRQTKDCKVIKSNRENVTERMNYFKQKRMTASSSGNNHM